jgi:hypothetical protein
VGANPRPALGPVKGWMPIDCSVGAWSGLEIPYVGGPWTPWTPGSYAPPYRILEAVCLFLHLDRFVEIPQKNNSFRQGRTTQGIQRGSKTTKDRPLCEPPQKWPPLKWSPLKQPPLKQQGVKWQGMAGPSNTSGSPWIPHAIRPWFLDISNISSNISSNIIGIWQGVVMDSLKFHLSPSCPTPLCPAGSHPCNNLTAVLGVAACRACGLWPSSTTLDTPHHTPLSNISSCRFHSSLLRKEPITQWCDLSLISGEN